MRRFWLNDALNVTRGDCGSGVPRLSAITEDVGGETAGGDGAFRGAASLMVRYRIGGEVGWTIIFFSGVGDEDSGEGDLMSGEVAARRMEGGKSS